ncbi:AMP-binding protein [Vreelandella rituensis]|uniref:Acyl-CoA synthetase n=1 Tax=Vreelandella rituensis TaxID=2282306 RepID=A0A368TP00_9GAMM|nr:AMP-binding protein [Halomonas rituensis]RCV86250.1 acyl-CoA synthetase [Halomonas rituensis]
MSTWLTPSLISQLLRSLLQSELSTYRGVPLSFLPDAPAIDSLERLYLASSVAEFFCLHETGIEDRLLMEESVEAWSQLVAQAVAHTSGLVFRTSGSTGEPKACHHRWADIEAEAWALHQRLSERMTPERVVAWLPLHHLYGFMLGMAYPANNGLEVTVADKALPPLREGDVVVTVPPRWAYLAKARSDWPKGVVGVSSTAPLPGAVAETLSHHGIAAVMEIYGSSETGGVATRFSPAEPFTLLSHWHRETSETLVAAHEDNRSVALPDQVTWRSKSRFTLAGRHDDIVSIGGVNVSTTAVAQQLEALSDVSQCAVRPVQAGDGQTRLKAFVVPVDASRDDIATRIDATLKDWPSAQRPISITYGEALPRNTMGKLTNW